MSTFKKENNNPNLPVQPLNQNQAQPLNQAKAKSKARKISLILIRNKYDSNQTLNSIKLKGIVTPVYMMMKIGQMKINMV